MGTITHGMTSHPLYNTWRLMVRRTKNKNDKRFSSYGGRGIVVCDRWSNVENFIEDMYPSFKDGLSIDRIDNDGHYEPSNCRWATRAQQDSNKCLLRSTNKSGFNGVSWHKTKQKWQARIVISGTMKHLGYRESSYECAVIYDDYAVKNNINVKKNLL